MYSSFKQFGLPVLDFLPMYSSVLKCYYSNNFSDPEMLGLVN